MYYQTQVWLFATQKSIFNRQVLVGKITLFRRLATWGEGGLERVTGRKARGLQMEEIGYKCQTFFFFNLPLKQQEEKNN